jgi:hypothetical protein
MNRVAFLAEVLPACLILQDRHQYVHGHMTILDRAALEGASCKSYGTVRQHFDRLGL